MKFGIGQAVRRVEDRRFLTGHGRFVADIDLTRQAFGAVLYSPHAHARILSIDTSNAEQQSGVIGVLTGQDCRADKIGGLTPKFMPERMGGPPGYSTVRPILIADTVRSVGDRIAFVIAESEETARTALDLIEVDFEPLPAVVELEEAARNTSAQVWPDCKTGNISCTIEFGDAAATETAFKCAAHVVSARLENNRLCANPIEPRAAIGDYSAADSHFTLYTCSQAPHQVRSIMAEKVFGVAETKIRVISPDVGGGFGMKADPYPEDVLVLWASRKFGRPVKWVGNRSEALIGDSHARDMVVEGELALDENGIILAIRAHGIHGLGAYFSGAAAAPLFYALMFIPGAYNVQTVYLTNSAVFTHTPPFSVYRGAGRPEGTYLIERLMDKAAVELGIDGLEIRRRNLITVDALPYQTPVEHIYDSGEFHRIMAECAKQSDWDGFEARRKITEGDGKLRGRAVSYFIERGGNFNERMELKCDPGGDVTIFAGTHSHGQGHATVYAQMVSGWLGVDIERIGFVQGDTDKVLFGRGTMAARSSLVGGCALKMAADEMIKKAKPMAAQLLESAETDIEFTDGEFRVTGTDRAMPFADVAKAFFAPAGFTESFGVGLEAAGFHSGDPPNFPNGCHIAEVVVDPETGKVEVERYTAVDDVGVVI
ncbi:MAG: xanthine dehydrogenase family protein, partial [Rhodospirillales bacterium]|nr:xanthine dehydrogenase family protein [Rhodospirillales bacterium]